MKISKQNATWIFIVSILTMFLALSIYLGASGWYFSGKQNYASDFQLGRIIQLEAKPNQADAKSLNIEGAFLPEERLPQTVAIKNYSEQPLFVRVRAKIENEQSVFSLDVGETSNWHYNSEDGYYYLKDAILQDEKVSFCSYISISENLLLHSSKKYLITFIVEAYTENLQNILEKIPAKSV